VRAVRTKKRCCKANQRCKRCPVVLERLEKAGYAERTSKRNYRVLEVVPKKAMKRARTR